MDVSLQQMSPGETPWAGFIVLQGRQCRQAPESPMRACRPRLHCPPGDPEDRHECPP